MKKFTNKEDKAVDIPGTHLCVPIWGCIEVTIEQYQNMVLECKIPLECFTDVPPTITIWDIAELNLNIKQKFVLPGFRNLPDWTCEPKWICYEENDDWTINPDAVWFVNVPADCTFDRRISPQG